MSTSATDTGSGGVIDRLRMVGWGSTDTRIRATWRVLLAMPILWVLTGGVLTGNVQSAIDAIPSGGATGSGLAQSVLHGGFFLVALLVWARYLDRQSLADYGVSLSRPWVRDGLVGFAAVVIAAGAWTALTAAVGGKSIEIALAVPKQSLLLGVLVPFIALLLHAAVQQVVFFRVIPKAAAEGLHSRGITATNAALAAVLVAVVFFILMHGSTTPLRIVDLAVAGSVFGLLYLHTGEVGLGIGAHFGALYSSIVLSAIVQETGTLSGTLGTLDQYGFPTMLIAYVGLVAWLHWWQGEVAILPAIARLPDT